MKVNPEQIYNILQEILPNELEDYFNITDEKEIDNFIYDIIVDIKQNLDT